MSIKQHYQTARQNITAEKERAISVEKDRVTKEQIIPNNAEVDKFKAEAINALTTKLNQDIANLQNNFNAEKASIIEASEKKKSAFAEQAISTAVSLVSLEYDKAISDLDKRIGEIKD